MQMPVNNAARRAIETAIRTAEDNLARFRMAEERMPGSKTGNGELYIEVIHSLEREIAELKQNL